MEFPRGRFIGIRKGLCIRDLLDELMQVRFTGYCIVSQGRESGSLLLKNGICILAEFKDLTGNPAWSFILDLQDTEIDAQLVELSPAQLGLALEFNKYALIEHQKRQTRARTKSPVPGATSPERGGAEDPVNTSASHAEGQTIRVYYDPEQEQVLNGQQGVLNSTISGMENEEVETPDEGFIRDLSTLDGMDLKGMSDKIRENCRVIVQGLQLEHLLDQEENSTKD